MLIKISLTFRSTPSPLSSTNSSQDSLHKNQPPKKKGIKSSLGRFFSKKEKGKAKEALGKEYLQQGPFTYQMNCIILVRW